MSRMVIKRVSDLERLLSQQQDTWHQIIIQSGEDVDARIADLIASGKAKESDKFIFRQIVDPKLQEGAPQ